MIRHIDLILILPFLATTGCERSPTPAPSPKPSANGNKPAPPPVLDVPERYANLIDEDADRWLTIESTQENTPGGWATGQFIEGANKIVINTEDVSQFKLDLERINIDWTRRVVLRINGANSELTRKHYPTLRLRRTSGGSWQPLKD